MGRIARVVMPGWPHHITQRGNYRQTVFFSDDDRKRYLELIEKYNTLYHLDMIGFSLMSNHVHDVSIPEFKTSLAKGIGRTSNDYSRWLNIRHNQTGHLWQERFYSCPVEFVSLADVLAYVELNPVRAGLVKRPEEWKWSSARAHLTGVDESGLLNMDWWNKHFTPDSWADYLSRKMLDKTMLHRIRTATRTGRPLAGSEGIQQIETFLGRSLRPRKHRGRSQTS